MSSSSRRGFLALSATGVATGVAAVVAPGAMAADSPSEASSTGAQSGPVVAFVHDAKRGEVTVMHGEHEVLVHDPALVRLISKHA